MSDDRFNELFERLEADEELAGALEGDAFGALRDLGYADLVEFAEQERARVGALVERIYADDSFRQAVEEDPLRQLGDWGIPEPAIAPVLVLAGAPDDVVDRATADVEAHLGKRPASVAAMAAILGTLAFAQQATAAQPQAAAQAKPQATAQVQPAATAQLTPAAYAQITPAAQAQVVSAQRKRWQGVQSNRVVSQARILSFLRGQGIRF